MSFILEGGRISHLEIVFNNVENKIPVRSGYVLEDRSKMEEQNSHLAFHLFFGIFIRGHPLLARLHEVDRPRLRNENDI